MSERLESNRLHLEPEPTTVELEVAVAALAQARLLGAARSETVSAWHLAGLQESVDRAPEALHARDSASESKSASVGEMAQPLPGASTAATGLRGKQAYRCETPH